MVEFRLDLKIEKMFKSKNTPKKDKQIACRPRQPHLNLTVDNPGLTISSTHKP